MALLNRKTKNPIADTERELNDLVARRELFSQRLATAKTAHAVAMNERRMAMLDADLDDATIPARRNATVRECAR